MFIGFVDHTSRSYKSCLKKLDYFSAYSKISGYSHYSDISNSGPLLLSKSSNFYNSFFTISPASSNYMFVHGILH